MKSRSLAFAALALSIVAPSCAAGEDENVGASADAVTTIPNETAWAAGTRWTYQEDFMGLPRAWVYRPTTYSQKAPDKRGAIFHLLGCGERPYQLAQGAGWPEAAEAHGMVIVIPDIIAPSYPNQSAPNVACYNFGGSLAMQPSRTSPDHKAIIAAGERIAADADLRVDPRQVYLTGFSAGATVAMQVACMAPDIFAGVGSVAGPAVGADQSRAVMPPSVTAAQIKQKCTSYAQSSPVSTARDQLAKQLYVIVSDDNGLPAGRPVMDGSGHWTADKFANQKIWDGDKYVPNAYHDLIANGMSSLLGVTLSSSDVALPLTGTGTGCQGGAASHDDTGETECTFAQAIARDWQAKADVWTDSAGRKRLVQIRQDTLRHRWPAGPAGATDFQITPNRQTLIDNGYIQADGQFDLGKLENAPNGTIGAVYFAHDSFDFPMYFVDFLSANNPRL
jgi:poly(hydroxyalkanoate) depolymerase family esterase